ncbi:MAG: sel1 repeat family protein [Oscillospiraceae bacterium]|nr:sel1 repeat family protein [Oscillospiraceae bacterium]
MKTIEELKTLASQGDAESQCLLATYYDLGEGIEQDSKKALEWYEKAADQNHANAQGAIGSMYLHGREGVIAKDESKAFEWFKKAAEQGSATSQFFLGMCYYAGTGIKADQKQAIKWFKIAADNGDEDAKELLVKI